MFYTLLCDNIWKEHTRRDGDCERASMRTKIYFASTKALENEAVYRRLYEAASDQRKRKTDRYRFQKDRMLSLAAEGLLRAALHEAGYPGLSVYAYRANGKPYLPDADGFFFNLSHSGEYAMLAVSDAEIGCDIERIRTVDARLIERVLTPEERAPFPNLTETERNVLFTRYWVCKESYLKACGDGLSGDPASVRIETGEPVRVIRNGVPEEYAIREGDTIPNYRFAVCRKGEPDPVRIVWIDFEDITGGNINDH